MSLTAAQNRFTGFFGFSYFYGWLFLLWRCADCEETVTAGNRSGIWAGFTDGQRRLVWESRFFACRTAKKG